MNSRLGDVDYRQTRGIIKQILVTMIAVCPAVQTAISEKAYASCSESGSTVNEHFQMCSRGSHKACVVDGDTIWLDGQKIRIADIDTPEVGEPKCSSELALGNRATDRMLELINEGPFEIKAWPGRDVERYGRKLRVLIRDGRSLGDILVSEGLARTWSGRREPWC